MLTLLLCGQGQNGSSIISGLISNFQTRVASDGGVFEAQSCLNALLTNLNNIQFTPVVTVYNFEILNCTSDSQSVYSSSEFYAPGIFVYTNPELTLPFINSLGWSGGGEFYYIDPNGLVRGDFQICN